MIDFLSVSLFLLAIPKEQTKTTDNETEKLFRTAVTLKKKFSTQFVYIYKTLSTKTKTKN
jgi:hypothetical protein